MFKPSIRSRMAAFLRVEMKRFVSRWGRLRQIQIPLSIVEGGTISLETSALAAYLVLLHCQKSQAALDDSLWDQFIKDNFAKNERGSGAATARVSREKLCALTGFSVNKVTDAIRQLRKKSYIDPYSNVRNRRRKRGRFDSTVYGLKRPGSVIEPLWHHKGNNLMYANDVPYFTFPRCVIEEAPQPWSMAQISSSALRVYVGCVFLAHQAKRNDFDTSITEFKKLTRLDPRTVKKAIDNLEERGLICTSPKSHSLSIELCDPYTGQPIPEGENDAENDPANYFTTDARGVSSRAALNLSPAEVEKLVMSSISEDASVTRQSNGDLMICCPFHEDHTPSCSVSPSKRGAWHCFGCGEKGNLYKLVTKLGAIKKREAIQRIASIKGQTVQFRRPDNEALAIYSYRDKLGYLKKQVLRFPNDEQGNKIFMQRQPAPGGRWKWDVKGLPPLLYHVDLLKDSGTVCLVEGEKDADTMTNSGMFGRSGYYQPEIGPIDPIVGITSGGANSWDFSLATQLRGKSVILMPDADEAGRRYADAAKASLDAEHIEYREVSFGGTGVKDVSEYLEKHTVESLADLIGRDWVNTIRGKMLADASTWPIGLDSEVGDDPTEEIRI